MLTRKAIASRLLLLLGLTFPVAASAQTIVWTDGNANRIQRKDVSGGTVSTVVQFDPNQFPSDVHFEPLSRKLYYRLSSEGVSEFRRCNIDGSDTEIIATPTAGTFTINVQSQSLHWITPNSGNEVNRSELDGSNAVSHSYPTCCVFSLYAMGNHLFFGAGITMKKGIWRAEADGSDEHFLHITPPPFDLAFDPVEAMLYIATSVQIDRMNLDGTGFEVIVSLPAWQQEKSYPSNVKIDHMARKLYWSDPVAKVIQRSNLDGSNIEDFVSFLEAGNSELELRGLTIIQAPSIPVISSFGLGLCAAFLILGGTFVIRKRVMP